MYGLFIEKEKSGTKTTAEDAVKEMRNSKQAGKIVFTTDEYLRVF